MMSGRTLRSMSSAVEALVRDDPSVTDRGRRTRVAVITDEASLGAAAVVALARTSAAAPDLRQQTEMRIRHCAGPSASVRDFVDLTRTVSTHSLAAAVDALADDPGCDAVLVAVGVEDRGLARSLVGAVERVSRDHPETTVAVVCPAVPDRPVEPSRRRARHLTATPGAASTRVVHDGDVPVGSDR